MIQMATTKDEAGGVLVIGIKSRRKWIKYQLRYENFFSNKRLARLLRELADCIEKGDPSERSS